MQKNGAVGKVILMERFIPNGSKLNEWVCCNGEQDKAFHSVCKATRREETQTKVHVLPQHRRRNTLKAFVYKRFNNRKKALPAFDRHEKSELLRSALQLIPNQRNEAVLELLHKQKMEVMKKKGPIRSLQCSW